MDDLYTVMHIDNLVAQQLGFERCRHHVVNGTLQLHGHTRKLFKEFLYRRGIVVKSLFTDPIVQGGGLR